MNFSYILAHFDIDFIFLLFVGRVYKYKFFFNLLTLYSVALLNSFILIVHLQILFNFLGTYTMVSRNRILFLPFSSLCLLFMFLLISLSSTSSTVLTRCGDSQHPRLVPNQRESFQHFTSRVVQISIRIRTFHSVSKFAENLDSEWMFKFIKCFCIKMIT